MFFHRITLLTFFISAFAFQATAQMERTIYHVFQIDSIQTVTIDTLGEYELHSWAGNTLLVETNIRIWHASPEILGFLVEKGRYDVVGDTSVTRQLVITLKDRTRHPVKTPAGECTEIATARVFFPDTFVVTEDRRKLLRKKE